MAKNHKATFELSKDDIKNPLHPHLWSLILESFGVEPEAGEITIQLSKSDTNDADPRSE